MEDFNYSRLNGDPYECDSNAVNSEIYNLIITYASMLETRLGKVIFWI